MPFFKAASQLEIVLVHTRELNSACTKWFKHSSIFFYLFKPSSIFNDRSPAGLLLWIFFVIYVSCLSLLCCLVCSLQHCDHLLEKAYLLARMCVTFSCVFLTTLYGVPSQVWYLIVSIPDLCILFHLNLN